MEKISNEELERRVKEVMENIDPITQAEIDSWDYGTEESIWNK